MARRLIVLALFFWTQGCVPFAAAQQKNPSLFNDVAEQVGLRFQHYNGMTGKFYLPEIMGSGAALWDFDNDGDLDVFLVQGNVLEPNTLPNRTLFPWRGAEPPRGKLFRNDLNASKFTDVTQQSGIVANGYGMGVAVGDINNDGLPDLYLSNLGSNQMYLNQGQGKFLDVTKQSGTDDPRWSTSAAFFDYDRDGWLDLMVVNYADFSVTNNPACYAATTAKDYCTPRAFRAPGNRLFHNKGNGTFADVTLTAGVNKEFGHGLGIVTADFNNDGWIDIYVANDGDPNQLWTNQKNGTFVNDALLAGCAVNRNGQAEAGMGIDAGDFDGNGTEDIFVTHLMEETNTLYVNLGRGLFEDRTRESNLGMPGRRFTGFGASFFDYDNDGWLDLFVANGAVQLLPELVQQKNPFPLGQPNQLFRNTGKGSFVETEAGPEFSLLEVSRGAAFGDIDNDGDTDFLLTNNSGPARLFLNQVGNRNHWLGLRLVGKTGRDMLGARVEIVADKNILWRRVRTDGSYLSANDPRVVAGLGAATQVKAVRVHWPDGTTEEWKDLPVDRYTTLKQSKTAFAHATAHSQTPDVSNLEESVREQITTAQAALAAAKRNPATTKTALSEEYGKLGEIYHAYSLISAARDCYVNASLLAPQDFRWIYLLGKLDQQEGRFDDAIRRYRAARTMRPDYVATLVNLGNILLELNRLDDASESFSAALALDKNNPAAHYGLGQVAMSKRNYAKAADHFEKTLAQVPGANRVHYSLAMAYRGLGDVEKVKAHLAQQGPVGVRVADPLVDGLQDLIAGERVHLARGKVAFEARRYAEAATEFRKAVDSKPDSVTARINLGAALTQVGDLKGALEQFEEALRIEPGRVNAHYNLAVILAGQKNHEQAILHLRSVLNVAENDLNARLLLAQELKNSGRADEALTEFTRVAYLLAASSETDSRDGARALELAQRVYSATGAAQHGALVALALAELGRCREAAEWQQRMIAAAEQQGNTGLPGKLRADFKLYENAQSYRPRNKIMLRDVLFETK